MKQPALLLISFTLASHVAFAAIPNDDEQVDDNPLSAPINHPQFSAILSASKLQISKPGTAPGSKYELAKDGDFSGIVNQHFYVDGDNEALVFNMAGYKLRNELRVLENFNVSQPETLYHLSAQLQPVDPYASVQNSPRNKKEITYLQVHNKGTHEDGTGYIPHPLARITWELERNGKTGHYWAVVKMNNLNCSTTSPSHGTDDCNNAYQHFDLGLAELDRPTHFDLHVGNNQLVINVDGETKLAHDIGYWQDLLSYFKAGGLQPVRKWQ